MAAIPVTIIGTMTYSDLSVGGGPMPPSLGEPTHPIVIPPDAIAPGVPTHPIVIPQPPNVIWPSPGVPTHPWVPPSPGGPPTSPGVPTHPWIPPGGNIPAHPIVLPPEAPPTQPPDAGTGSGGWNYSPNIGWYWTSPGGRWIYVAGDKPSPPQVPNQPPQS